VVDGAGTVAVVATLRSVAVFCGSSRGTRERYAEVAQECGTALARRDIQLVYGGGAVGLMGTLADACLAEGGRVIGVIPEGLFTREVGHLGVTELHEVGSMHERKQLMYDLADGFLGLPGGYGTLEEVAEVTTWAQLGLHAKPVALVDVEGFWRGLVTQLDHMVDAGFLKPANRQLIERCDSVEDALGHLATAESLHAERVITPDER
jgi:uncharacterized protein (TIGR00730 family)